MLDKIQFHICIVAALVTLIVGILQDISLAAMAFRLIFIIILFYFIGLFVRSYLRRKVFVSDNEPSGDAVTTTMSLENENKNSEEELAEELSQESDDGLREREQQFH